jgi:hypothetical protein
VRRSAEIRPNRAITQKPSGRTDDDSEELREPTWAPRHRRHRAGPRATSEDIPKGPSLLDGGVQHDSVSVQPESTLLDSLELIEVGVSPTSAPTCATLRRLTVRVTPLTLPRAGRLPMMMRNVESGSSFGEVN